MLNEKDFKNFPKQTPYNKTFILRMMLTDLLEMHLVEIKDLIKMGTDSVLQAKTQTAIDELKHILSLLEYEEECLTDSKR